MKSGIFILLALLQTAPHPKALEWYRKGEALIGTERAYTEEQAGYFAQAVEADPKFAEARFNLGLIRLRQNRLPEARDQFVAYVSLAPKDAKGYFMKARSEMELGRHEEAAADLKAGLDLDPNDGEAWAVLGRLHFNEGRFDQAREVSLRSARTASPPSDIDYQIARASRELERLDEAAGHIESHLEKYPDDADARFFAGVLYIQREERDLALEHLLAAERHQPDNSDLAQVLGNLFLDLNRPQEAQSRLERADGESAVNLANRAVIALGEKRYEEAESLLRRSLAKQPADALMWGYLGDALAAQEKALEAVAAYDRALDYDPKDLKSLINAGTLSADSKRTEDARGYLERALAQAPEDGFVHYSYAVVLERLGDSEGQAPSHFQESLRLNHDRPYAHFRLAFFHARKGDQAEALQHLEAALAGDAKRFHEELTQELRQVHSDLDSVRYTPAFAELMSRFRPQN